MVRRVLHATDFSRASQRAFAQAVEMARQNKAELLLFHVLTPLANYLVASNYEDPALYARLEESSRRDAESALTALAKKAQSARVKVRDVLARGAVHEEILRAAKRYKADMIVIGTHGRTGLAKLFMGSVAARVISAASCPVLTVRGR
ncbi:MAG TPA: universal stress protein [Candidatus Acidoferrales bacterium]|nr:universal stress protein [Candidatus Acidoferrales bacterium]